MIPKDTTIISISEQREDIIRATNMLYDIYPDMFKNFLNRSDKKIEEGEKENV